VILHPQRVQHCRAISTELDKTAMLPMNKPVGDQRIGIGMRVNGALKFLGYVAAAISSVLYGVGGLYLLYNDRPPYFAGEVWTMLAALAVGMAAITLINVLPELVFMAAQAPVPVSVRIVGNGAWTAGGIVGIVVTTVYFLTHPVGALPPGAFTPYIYLLLLSVVWLFGGGRALRHNLVYSARRRRARRQAQLQAQQEA
jgi:hypothetical protein